MPPKTKTEPLLTIEVLGIPHSFTQNQGETVSDFKVRVQKEFDSKGINIQII